MCKHKTNPGRCITPDSVIGRTVDVFKSRYEGKMCEPAQNLEMLEARNTEGEEV